MFARPPQGIDGDLQVREGNKRFIAFGTSSHSAQLNREAAFDLEIALHRE
jgi:hypothetical protein